MGAVKSEAVDSSQEKEQKGLTSEDANRIGGECPFDLLRTRLSGVAFYYFYCISAFLHRIR